MSTIEEKLRSEVQQTHWDALAIHAERGRLIMVTPQIDLLEAALAVAQDRTKDVETYLSAGLIHKLTEAQIAVLDAEDNPKFNFVIVQPFVLASRLEDTTDALN
ncbi:MAG: DUF2288 family protein [Deltaproteobacteria bacterium]|jgi:hypothetical protein|nr:DUF2288 family protein [Deltaproteobacteria bacterium]MBT6434093.1 DUF2288 family protein [Deltaproteobacteria bacterium]MBT6491941.1 DUF2288 family protein [Deltaproteobacteria bacterium]